MKQPKSSSRRDFVKKAAYVAPAVLTLTALPAFEAAGSTRDNDGRRGGGRGRGRGRGGSGGNR
jgi:hypothetical protein